MTVYHWNVDEAELHWLQPKEIGRRENKSIPVKGETFTGNEENVHWNGRLRRTRWALLLKTWDCIQDLLSWTSIFVSREHWEILHLTFLKCLIHTYLNSLYPWCNAGTEDWGWSFCLSHISFSWMTCLTHLVPVHPGTCENWDTHNSKNDGHSGNQKASSYLKDSTVRLHRHT